MKAKGETIWEEGRNRQDGKGRIREGGCMQIRTDIISMD